jgi:serine phosphatase RsbU (regulator of sigma subunit)
MSMSDKVTDTSLLIEWGVAGQAFAGRAESGDQCLVESFPDGALVAVVDGLGHSLGAATVAKDAVTALEGHAHEPVASLLRRCHERLRGSRGVVMSLASFNAHGGTMTWLGVGNVEGLLLRGDGKADLKHERLLLRGGVVGYRLPTLRPVALTIMPGDTLIFATDGIRSSFADNLTLDGTPQQAAERILARHGRETDDALVLVARYVGGGS